MVKVNKETKSVSINLPSYEEFKSTIKTALPANEKQTKRTLGMVAGGVLCDLICDTSVIGIASLVVGAIWNGAENNKKEIETPIVKEE